MIGTSLQMTAIRKYLARVARFNTHVLITGETGTGKELTAEMLHAIGLRSKCSFSTFNCAAIPDSLVESELFGHEKGAFTGAETKRDGLFASAQGGTVFLDEIGEMPLSGEAKLLRVLETKQVRRLGSPRSQSIDLRIVAATNQNLEELVAHRKFRGDLFYRLNVARVHLPPLRERKEGIGSLIAHFLDVFNELMGRHVVVPSSGPFWVTRRRRLSPVPQVPAGLTFWFLVKRRLHHPAIDEFRKALASFLLVSNCKDSFRMMYGSTANVVILSKGSENADEERHDGQVRDFGRR